MKRFLRKLFGSGPAVTPAGALRAGKRAGGGPRFVFAFPPIQRTTPNPSDPNCTQPPQWLSRASAWATGQLARIVEDFTQVYAKLYRGLTADRETAAAFDGVRVQRSMNTALYRAAMLAICSIEIAVLAAAYAGVGESWWLMRWAPAVLSGVALMALAHYCGVHLRELAEGHGNERSHQMIATATVIGAACVLTAAASVRGMYFARSVEAGTMSGVNPTLVTAVMVGVNIGAYIVAVLLSHSHHRTDEQKLKIKAQEAHDRLAASEGRLNELVVKYQALADREAQGWRAIMNSFCAGFEQASGFSGCAWMRPQNMPAIAIPNFAQLASKFQAEARAQAAALEHPTPTIDSSTPASPAGGTSVPAVPAQGEGAPSFNGVTATESPAVPKIVTLPTSVTSHPVATTGASSTLNAVYTVRGVPTGRR